MPKYRGVTKKNNKWYYWIWFSDIRKLKWFGSFDTAEEAKNARAERLNKIIREKIPPHKILLKDFIV
jgi:hypothetical protein